MVVDNVINDVLTVQVEHTANHKQCFVAVLLHQRPDLIAVLVEEGNDLIGVVVEEIIQRLVNSGQSINQLIQQPVTKLLHQFITVLNQHVNHTDNNIELINHLIIDILGILLQHLNQVVQGFQ